MKEKEQPNWFLRILGILFFVYLALMIAMQMGYHEAKLGEQTTLTKEKMEAFEQDVKDGKPVDINDYIETETKDFSNGINKAGAAVSGIIESFMTDGITKTVDILKTLFT